MRMFALIIPLFVLTPSGLHAMVYLHNPALMSQATLLRQESYSLNNSEIHLTILQTPLSVEQSLEGFKRSASPDHVFFGGRVHTQGLGCLIARNQPVRHLQDHPFECLWIKEQNRKRLLYHAAFSRLPTLEAQYEKHFGDVVLPKKPHLALTESTGRADATEWVHMEKAGQNLNAHIKQQLKIKGWEEKSTPEKNLTLFERQGGVVFMKETETAILILQHKAARQ